MPLATLAAQVTAAGISAPSYTEILQSLQESVQGIYGSDVYIDPDSQDGQFLALLASAINDSNQMAISTYNAFSPSFAQGVGLSSVVKINGIRRLAPSHSTAVGSIIGQTGTVISNGVVEDDNGNLWDLPTLVTIPTGGEIEVTVTAQEAGSISAPSGTITGINTPTRGWQSFTSTEDSTVGSPTESDATLRRRQTSSVALPAQTPLGSMVAAIANLEGVTRSRVYENPTGLVDANGLPAHSISVVVEGGTLQDIVDTIGAKKTPGANTYGTTSGTYTDPVTGIPYTIEYFDLASTDIVVEIIGTAGDGYSSSIDDEIKDAIVAYLNGLEIGQDVEYSRMWGPSYLNGLSDGLTYRITSMQIAISGDPLGVADLAVAFNAAAACIVADVTVTIT